MGRRSVQSALLLLVCAVLTGMVSSSAPAVEFSGALANTNTPPGLIATGLWAAPQPDLIGWDVSQNMDGTWHYAYGLSVPVQSATNFIVELPTTFTAADILNPIGSFSSFTVGTFTPGAQFPFLPGSIYGANFILLPGTNTQVAFDAAMAPGWGNFYGQGVDASVLNAGFNLPNPTVDPKCGSVDHKILVPSPNASPIPEASTLLLAAVGMLPFALAGRSRRR